MHPLLRTLRFTLLAVAVTAAIALPSGAARAQTASNKIPSNYRTQIARYLLSLGLPQRSLNSAMIATPYNKPDGIWGRLANTTVPVICVSNDTKNMLGQEFKGYFVFWFEDGQLRRWNTGSGVLASECGTFSPFNEVIKR
jgi:hypothetical protein